MASGPEMDVGSRGLYNSSTNYVLATGVNHADQG